jgi:hypothetical protein
MVDTSGHVWAMEDPRSGQEGPGMMYVLEPDGCWLGTLMGRSRFRGLDIGDGFILGVWRDEFDVEYLHLYQLTRG